jgi:prolyl oligopeptidase
MASNKGSELEDPWMWLEDVTGEKSLAYVSERNANSKALIEKSSSAFGGIRDRILSILDSKDKIPMIAKHGKDKDGNDLYYNLWKSEDNKRGLWRRTTLASYRTDEPNWETVLDIDELGRQENENWVYSGSVFLEPENRYCLLYLSRGGADATVVREFDVVEKRFIPVEEGGFALPEAKSRISWRNKDSVFVGTVFPGVADSLTDSGYPRIVRQWARSSPLSESETVYEGKKEDVSISGYRDLAEGFQRDFIERGVTFWTNESFYRDDSGAMIQIRKQDDAEARVHKDWLYIELRSDWEPCAGVKYKAGALLATNFDAYVKDKVEVTSKTFSLLFEPTERKSLASYSPLANTVVLNELENVQNRIYVLSPPSSSAGEWKRKELSGFPALCTVAVSAVDADVTNEIFCVVSGYLTPSSLYFGELESFASASDTSKSPLEFLKKTPEFFDIKGLEVTQHFVPSIHDGTSIPYFQVAKEDLVLDGTNRTLLYGYGGFEISLTPGYQATTGVGWLERGGVCE